MSIEYKTYLFYLRKAMRKVVDDTWPTSSYFSLASSIKSLADGIPIAEEELDDLIDYKLQFEYLVEAINQNAVKEKNGAYVNLQYISEEMEGVSPPGDE